MGVHARTLARAPPGVKRCLRMRAAHMRKAHQAMQIRSFATWLGISKVLAWAEILLLI